MNRSTMLQKFLRYTTISFLCLGGGYVVARKDFFSSIRDELKSQDTTKPLEKPSETQNYYSSEEDNLATKPIVFIKKVHADQKIDPKIDKKMAERNAPIPFSRDDCVHEKICAYNLIPDIAEQCLPSIVSIIVMQVSEKKLMGKDVPLPPTPFGDILKDLFELDKPHIQKAQGSGFFIKGQDDRIYIVTNYHVVSRSTEILVYLYDKTKIKAEIKAFDEKSDLAILEIKDQSKIPTHIPTLEWGDFSKIKIGQTILAFGNPFGFGSTVTSGIISSKGREIPSSKPGKYGHMLDLVQHDAPLNMGSSGGPLIGFEKDQNGRFVARVIGINTAIFTPHIGNVGIGFAIPSSIAAPIIRQLITDGKISHSWLGVNLCTLNDEQKKSMGIEAGEAYTVAEVLSNSPAFKAGIKSGDIIIEYDGRKISPDMNLQYLVDKTPIGREVPLKIISNGKIGIVTVKIEERKDEETQDSQETPNVPSIKDTKEVLGMVVSDVSKEICARYFPNEKNCKGVFVVKVGEGGLAGSAGEEGMRKGDLITKLNTRDVLSVADFLRILEEEKKNGRTSVMLDVRRNGGEHAYPTIPLE